MSSVRGSNAGIVVLDGSFDGRLSELSVPASGGQPVAITLLEQAQIHLKDRAALIYVVVESGVLGDVNGAHLPLLNDRTDIVGQQPPPVGIADLVAGIHVEPVEVTSENLPADFVSYGQLVVKWMSRMVPVRQLTSSVTFIVRNR